MKPTFDDVIKLARQYIDGGMKYMEALERAKKELNYKGLKCVEVTEVEAG